jgi:hypothetical protein
MSHSCGIYFINKCYLVNGSLCIVFGLIQLGFGLLVKVGVIVLLGKVKILGLSV